MHPNEFAEQARPIISISEDIFFVFDLITTCGEELSQNERKYHKGMGFIFGMP